MKTIDVNIVPSVVTSHTQLISKVSSLNGTQVVKVEVKDAWFGSSESSKSFEEEKRKYETGEKKGFILNRSPRGLCLRKILIAGVILAKDPMTEDYVIAINPHDDGTADMILPIDDSAMKVLEKTTAEAVAEAIRGEKDHFFIDAKGVAAIVNAAMQRDVTYLDEVIENCKKAKVRLQGFISDNENKAQAISDAWTNSALPTNVDIPAGVSGAKVHVTVTDK